MSTAFLYGNGASGSGGKIIVTAPAGSTVTVSKDGKVKTKVAGADGLAVFKGLDSGTWRVCLLNEDGSEHYSWDVAVTVDYTAVVDFFDGYLYNAGDERELFTGGWSGAEKKSTYMALSVTNTGSKPEQPGQVVEKRAFTVLPFDTTGYTKITINCVRNNYAYAYFGIASMDKKSVSKVSIPTTKDNKTLDISSYQGEYLLYFSCQMDRFGTGPTAQARVYSVKIE